MVGGRVRPILSALALGLTLAISFSLVLAACTRPDSGFDVGTLEASIPVALVPDDPSVVTGVSCPQLATSAATTSACTALVAGEEIEIVATISAEGLVSVSTDAILLDVAGVASEASRRLSKDLGVESEVSCPGSVRVIAAGDSFSCQATDPAGPTHDITITVLDSTGTWSMELAS